MIIHKLISLLLLLPWVSACGIEEYVLQNPAPTLVIATQHQIENTQVVPNSYLVMFKTEKPDLLLSHATFLTEFKFHYSWLQDSYLADSRIKNMDYITTLDMSDPKEVSSDDGLEVPRTLQLAWDGSGEEDLLGSLVTIDFENNEVARQVLEEWEAQGKIWYAEPNYYNYNNDIFSDAKTAYEEADIWWHQSINLYEAFETLSKREIPPHPSDDDIVPPVIAVLDSGVQINHPGLEGRIWQNNSPGVSGCPNDVNGCNTTEGEKGVLGTGDVTPFGSIEGRCPTRLENAATTKACGHGSHVAGIISGKLDATKNTGGVCPVCKIMTIRIIANAGGKGLASDAAILRGMKYLTLFKAKNNAAVRVVNSSFGKYTRVRSVGLLVSALKKKPHEVVIVGAAGNEDSMKRSYPAGFSDAIAVSSVQRGGAKAFYSNFGPWIDVAAPGGNTDLDGGIVSTVDTGSDLYEPYQGTSMATPVVAGVIGLILSIDPNRGFTDLRDSIILGSNRDALYGRDQADGYNYNFYYPQVGGESVRRPLLGSGLLDANAAILGKGTGVNIGTISRVKSGCSVLGLGTNVNLTGLLMMILPCILGFLRLLQTVLTNFNKD